MRVVHFHRKPFPGQFSIEGYFERVRRAFCDVDVRVAMCPFYSKGLLPRLKNILSARKEQGDVNHITGDVHYISFLMTKRKTLLTVLDCEMLNRLSGWRRFLLKLCWFTIPVRRVSWMTTISQATKDRLLEVVKFPQERVVVVPVSVSEMFTPMPQAFHSAKPKLLQVGTKHNKNLERLIPALEGITCSLEILGKLSETQRDLLSEYNIDYSEHVNLSQEEVVALYQHCDMLVFASTYEGFGMPIVEAQVVERPVIAGNTSSMPEVAGEGALLVDPFSIESIREGVLKVISDAQYREHLVERGRMNHPRFAHSRIVQQYLDLYKKVNSEQCP